MKVYEYKNCGTCKKALKFLSSNGIEYKAIPIREQPPTQAEIKKMLKEWGVKRLFNTSGKDYRELGIKDKLASMNEVEIVKLLNSNGNLIKRPFVISKDVLLIGFKEEEWKEKLL